MLHDPAPKISLEFSLTRRQCADAGLSGTMFRELDTYYRNKVFMVTYDC